MKDITPAPKSKISLPFKIIITIAIFLLSGILVISAMRNDNLSLGYHSDWEIQLFFIITTLLICWHLPANIKTWPIKKKLIFGVTFFFIYMLLMFGSIALLIYISIKTE
ncbi:hypothetical protein SAMN05216297_107192 [Flavobacterium phragmitis]|uniref:Uncharacterized protein n=1 Tax=Flavobacterium phragmitis TaxID=739143 RepID=A0A1I1S6J5_9FLAO|nr:hypothetical protein SAMN05216297_107192 [Flavobacterium phragmitis]